MKHPGPYIRRSLYTLLNETITHKTFLVPAYESEYVGPPVPYKIEIAAMDGFNEEDKHQYNHDISVTLEIIDEGSTWQRANVDAIGQEVMMKLKPTKFTTGLPNSEEWQITNLKIQPLNYMEDSSGSGTKITRLLLRVDFDIHQL